MGNPASSRTLILKCYFDFESTPASFLPTAIDKQRFFSAPLELSLGICFADNSDMPARQDLVLVTPPSSSSGPESATRAPLSTGTPRPRLPSSIRERVPESRRDLDPASARSTEVFLQKVMEHTGVTGAALADWGSGEVINVAGGGAGVDMELAAAVHCDVVRAKVDALRALSPRGAIEPIEDIVVTLPTQWHVMRPLPAGADERTEFLFVAISRSNGNLALARIFLANLTQPT